MLLLAGALASLGGAAAAPEQAGPTVTVVYSGTASNRMTFTNPAGERNRTDEVTVTWTFRYVGPVSKLSGVVPFTSQSVQGFFSQTYAPPNADSSCAYTLSAGRGNALAATPQTGTLVLDLAVPNRAQPGDPSAQLVGRKTAGANCAPLAGGLPVVGNWASAPHPAAPRVEVDLGRNTPQTWKFTAHRTWDDGRKNDYRLTSTVVVSPGTVKHTGGPPTTPKEVRALALDFLRPTLTRALYPCLTAVTGVIVFSSTGPAIGPVVGGTMVAVAGPVCAQLIRDLKQLELVVNDPPVAHYTVVAKVPPVPSRPVAFVPCTRYPQDGRALCARLQRAAQEWFDATRRLGAVFTTLATTVGRESAAAKAGNTAALRKQQQAALALVPVAETAARAEAAAARELAKVLRSAGATGTLSAAQSERAVSIVRDKLRRAGVGAAGIRAITGTSSRPGRVDVLALLGKR